MYDASSIKVIEPKFDPTFDWELVENLSHQYNKPVDWIRRGIEACRLSGESPEYFIDKYLDKKDIATNEKVGINLNQLIDAQRGY